MGKSIDDPSGSLFLFCPTPLSCYMFHHYFMEVDVICGVCGFYKETFIECTMGIFVGINFLLTIHHKFNISQLNNKNCEKFVHS